MDLAGLFVIVGGLLVNEKHLAYTNQVRAKNKFLLMYYTISIYLLQGKMLRLFVVQQLHLHTQHYCHSR